MTPVQACVEHHSRTHQHTQSALSRHSLVLPAEQGGLKLTSNARAALMSRLAGENVAGSGSNMVPMGQQQPGPSRQLPMPPQEPQIQWTNPNIVMEQGMLGPKSPIPTQCLLLKNMFDPAA